MPDAILTEINILLPMAVLLLMLTVLVSIDPYIRRKQRGIMLGIIVMIGVLITDEYLTFYAEHVEAHVMLRTVCDIIDYSLRTAILAMFCQLVDIRHKHRAEWMLVMINFAVDLTALWSGISFQITPDNHFIRGPLGYTTHVVGAVLLARFVWLALREYGNSRRIESGIPVIDALLVIAAVMIDSFGGSLRFLQVSMLLPVILICSMSLYVWLHLQYVREHEADIRAAKRLKILSSLMHPHFIYNSLTAVRASTDRPEKAEEILSNFTGFLRGSIDLMNCDECIDARREFEMVEHFLYLQKERFGDRLTVEYEISDMDFRLPAFTIQELVANAVNHGIRNNKGGCGTLVIRSFETEDAHMIEVTDDGAGFAAAGGLPDAGAQDMPSEGTHFGLASIKERLESMCGGSLCITSSPGEGTRAVVRIPKA